MQSIEKQISTEIFYENLMYRLLCSMLIFGIVMLTLISIVIGGEICLHAFDMPAFFADRRDSILFYGVSFGLTINVATRYAVYRSWSFAWKQLSSINQKHIAKIKDDMLHASLMP